MSDNKILIVEDDQTLLGVIKYNLVKNGYAVVTATDGVQALDVARNQKPDLMILDLMLPKLDGLEVCRILRQEIAVPIIMLTARTEEVDKVVGLELGADDYVTKPFSMRELVARVRAMLRRKAIIRQETGSEKECIVPVLKAGDLEMDFNRHQVSFGGAVLELSRKEFDLLAVLAGNPGRVFSRDHLLEKVWGYDFSGGTRTVDVHVRWLRQKIESDPACPSHIVTVRGVGYKFEE